MNKNSMRLFFASLIICLPGTSTAEPGASFQATVSRLVGKAVPFLTKTFTQAGGLTLTTDAVITADSMSNNATVAMETTLPETASSFTVTPAMETSTTTILEATLTTETVSPIIAPVTVATQIGNNCMEFATENFNKIQEGQDAITASINTLGTSINNGTTQIIEATKTAFDTGIDQVQKGLSDTSNAMQGGLQNLQDAVANNTTQTVSSLTKVQEGLSKIQTLLTPSDTTADWNVLSREINEKLVMAPLTTNPQGTLTALHEQFAEPLKEIALKNSAMSKDAVGLLEKLGDNSLSRLKVNPVHPFLEKLNPWVQNIADNKVKYGIYAAVGTYVAAGFAYTLIYKKLKRLNAVGKAIYPAAQLIKTHKNTHAAIQFGNPVQALDDIQALGESDYTEMNNGWLDTFFCLHVLLAKGYLAVFARDKV